MKSCDLSFGLFNIITSSYDSISAARLHAIKGRREYLCCASHTTDRSSVRSELHPPAHHTQGDNNKQDGDAHTLSAAVSASSSGACTFEQGSHSGWGVAVAAPTRAASINIEHVFPGIVRAVLTLI